MGLENQILTADVLATWLADDQWVYRLLKVKDQPLIYFAKEFTSHKEMLKEMTFLSLAQLGFLGSLAYFYNRHCLLIRGGSSVSGFKNTNNESNDTLNQINEMLKPVNWSATLSTDSS